MEQRNAYLETHCKKLEENLDSEQKEKILALSKAESFESDLQKVSKCALKNWIQIMHFSITPGSRTWETPNRGGLSHRCRISYLMGCCYQEFLPRISCTFCKLTPLVGIYACFDQKINKQFLIVGRCIFGGNIFTALYMH